MIYPNKPFFHINCHDASKDIYIIIERYVYICICQSVLITLLVPTPVPAVVHQTLRLADLHRIRVVVRPAGLHVGAVVVVVVVVVVIILVLVVGRHAAGLLELLRVGLDRLPPLLEILRVRLGDDPGEAPLQRQDPAPPPPLPHRALLLHPLVHRRPRRRGAARARRVEARLATRLDVVVILAAAATALLSDPGEPLRGNRLNGVGQRHVSRGLVLGDVGAVLVLDAKEGPHATARDLGEGDEEGDDGGVLRVVGEDGVKDPGKTQDRVDHHDDVVRPVFLETGDVAEEPHPAARLEEGKVHEQVPDGWSPNVSIARSAGPRTGPKQWLAYMCRWR
ncbi:hypothetical protein LX36DRAFT_224902 [Colletotrichum falcatum]|nr:hypothetical protein LX36DRAFT_224902 [Colletotrichum falcatum]